MTTFKDFPLPEALHATLDKMGFTTPTEIQAKTLTQALDLKDMIGTAQTGTGKTGAFAIPLAAKLLEQKNQSLLVLTPTRELAMQVISVFNKLVASDKSIRSALLIGGEKIDRQFRSLKDNPRIIVGTPGRINDHMKRGTLKVGHIKSLVLDETDLMLDMGFDVQIATIIDRMPADRHTLMFSATLPKKIEGLASKYLQNPTRISVGKQSTPGQNIQQDMRVIQQAEKHDQLTHELDNRDGSIIIFVKTKRGADRLSLKLNKEKHQSAAIHGDLKQSRRERTLADFRKKKSRILVATDVAARGIDVPHIKHVINYDLPQCPEDYVHRIGRTARAGEKGFSLSFVTPGEQRMWQSIQKLLDPNAKVDFPASKGNSGDRSRSKPKGKSWQKGKPGDRPAGKFKGKSDFKRSSDGGSDEKFTSKFKGKSDFKRSKDGGSDEKFSSKFKGKRDQKRTSEGGSDEKFASKFKGRSDQKRTSDGGSEDKFARPFHRKDPKKSFVKKKNVSPKPSNQNGAESGSQPLKRKIKKKVAAEVR